MQLATTLLIIHLFAGLLMTGVIWAVQLVHYPTFRYIPKSEFIRFEQFHARRITMFVMPFMLAEIIACFALLFSQPDGVVNWLAAALVLGCWGITFGISVPLHSQLAAGKQDKVIEQLIQTNWWRTAFWSLKSVLTASAVLLLLS